MRQSNGVRRWVASVDDVDATRRVEPTGCVTIVSMTLRNRGDVDRRLRVVESVPEAVTEVVPLATVSDEAVSWRRFGNWIVQELTVPAGGERTTGCVLESDEDPPVSLEEPEIETLPTDDDQHVPYSNRPDRSPAGTIDELFDGLTGRGEADDADQRETVAAEPVDDDWTSVADVEAADGEDGSTMVADLLEALESEATDDQRRSLRTLLGSSESDRTRIAYVQTRINDLEAYIDALEGLIDDHGVGVVDDLRESIDENTTATERLHDRVSRIADELDSHRSTTADAVTEVEAAVSDLDSAIESNLEEIESDIDSTRSDLTALRDEVRGERHAHARTFYELDRSISDVADAVERLETRVREMEAFRNRFTSVLAAEEGHDEQNREGHARPDDDASDRSGNESPPDSERDRSRQTASGPSGRSGTDQSGRSATDRSGRSATDQSGEADSGQPDRSGQSGSETADEPAGDSTDASGNGSSDESDEGSSSGGTEHW